MRRDSCLCSHSGRMVWCRRAALVSALLLPGSVHGSVPTDEQPAESVSTMILVIGAAGADEYERTFGEWADRWIAAAAAGGTSVTIIGRDDDRVKTDRERLQAALSAEMDKSQRELWLVMIGHGTFDGRRARFNLRGNDVSAVELKSWLSGCERPLAIINCASASAPFIDRLADAGRVVVTATKSGSEANYARFGDYLSQAIADVSADLDKDGQVSLLEAFLMASRQTQAYYDGQRQLATEHALLDDNGDARGVRADFFSGMQPTSQAEGGEKLDGQRAHQWHLIPSAEERRLPAEVRRRRNELELQLADLRDRKSDLDEDAYYDQIEPLLLEIARLYASVEDAPVEAAEPAKGASRPPAPAVPTPAESPRSKSP